MTYLLTESAINFLYAVGKLNLGATGRGKDANYPYV